jgi:SAD/SRA domain
MAGSADFMKEDDATKVNEFRMEDLINMEDESTTDGDAPQELGNEFMTDEDAPHELDDEFITKDDAPHGVEDSTAATVLKNHRGPIPGVEVGQLYQSRALLAGDRIHTAHQSGIVGTVKAGGALSIILSGGYEDNEDKGNTIIFTGQGQAKQKFTGGNLAMAESCAAAVNSEGATAQDWRSSKEIRVVRAALKGAHKNNFAPTEGLRYDGIYKVSEYTYEMGKNNHMVYKFTLKRDDVVAAPWTEEGKQRVEELGLKMTCRSENGGERAPVKKAVSSKTHSKAKGKAVATKASGPNGRRRRPAGAPIGGRLDPISED